MMDASRPPVPADLSCVMASRNAVRTHSAAVCCPGVLEPKPQGVTAGESNESQLYFCNSGWMYVRTVSEAEVDIA